MTHPFLPTEYERHKQVVTARARAITLSATVALSLVVVLIFLALLVKAAPALSPSLLWENPLDKGKAGGLWAPLIGTVWLVVLSVLLVSPIGVAAAIYLNEYAPAGRTTRLISLAVTSLAGVPSIVHALFGLGAFVLFARMGASLQAAACTLAVMNLPVVIAASREALGAVPRTFREACWNLGASHWHTLWTVVLPNSLGGILTGVIFAVSRAAGETAPILFTGAVFFATIPDAFPQRLAPYALDEPFMALAMHLHVISTQVSQMPHERTFATAVVLVTLVLLINSAAFVLRLRLRRNRKW
ncbi:MAG: phosphate ABC transporter permease PstA [Archangium sp.]|nr:phosphate ABC transporter permease PstA [Archangium sp.]